VVTGHRSYPTRPANYNSPGPSPRHSALPTALLRLRTYHSATAPRDGLPLPRPPPPPPRPRPCAPSHPPRRAAPLLRLHLHPPGRRGGGDREGAGGEPGRDRVPGDAHRAAARRSHGGCVQRRRPRRAARARRRRGRQARPGPRAGELPQRRGDHRGRPPHRRAGNPRCSHLIIHSLVAGRVVCLSSSLPLEEWMYVVSVTKPRHSGIVTCLYLPVVITDRWSVLCGLLLIEIGTPGTKLYYDSAT
jgi:hypothetical protein